MNHKFSKLLYCEQSARKDKLMTKLSNHFFTLEEVLKKTKDIHVYWANKDIFNTGVLEPKHMACTKEDSPSYK